MLAPGTLTVAVMDAGAATYTVTSWPRQSDMPAGRDWFPVGNESDVIHEVAEVVDSMAGGRGGYGNGYFRVTFRALTPLQVKYVRDLLFPSGVFSAAITARVFNRYGGAYEYYNGTGMWNPPAKNATPAFGGYDDVTIDVIEISAAAAS